MITVWVIVVILALFGFVVAFGAPYVPSLRKEVRGAFDTLYRVSDTDVVVDLGSGDGIVLLEATKRGAQGYGYEINPLLVVLAKLRLRSKATIKLANMWNVSLPKSTTLVYVFSVTRDSVKLGRFLQQQSDSLGRSFHVITFGAGLGGHTVKAEQRGHRLYEIAPTTAMQPETLTV